MINADNLIISKGESLFFFFFFNVSPVYFAYVAESDSASKNT